MMRSTISYHKGKIHSLNNGLNLILKSWQLRDELCLVRRMKLRLFGRARQRGYRRPAALDHLRDLVEVSGPDFALMLGRRVADFLSGKLGVLQAHVRAHLLVHIAGRKLEHAIVERMETGERNELELIAHRTEFALEFCDRRGVEVLAPVERR